MKDLLDSLGVTSKTVEPSPDVNPSEEVLPPGGNPSVDGNSSVREVTLMTATKIRIYPNGNIYLGDKKAWINETRSQPKKKPKARKKLKEIEIQQTEEY